MFALGRFWIVCLSLGSDCFCVCFSEVFLKDMRGEVRVRVMWFSPHEVMWGRPSTDVVESSHD